MPSAGGAKEETKNAAERPAGRGYLLSDHSRLDRPGATLVLQDASGAVAGANRVDAETAKRDSQ